MATTSLKRPLWLARSKRQTARRGKLTPSKALSTIKQVNPHGGKALRAPGPGAHEQLPPQPPRKHRYKPGTVALREIRREKNATGLIFGNSHSRASFERCCGR